ncbi:Thiamine-phosphate synthase [Lysobacter dokdonensis DS-58]|uniref:Thiamine-phosphate synthase n=1 Tax=Lysobacter dokdonensis DS-58 TaxID=1300345 RepID=A0A0A2WZ82_9GAMM|nr:thiamine phosphate synthase [Lysobacter dokdonensis]KGQ18294.1 Thiamine-phosphate synthase [Lysobacter dokdonensis DS-58]
MQAGLYLITPDEPDTQRLLERVRPLLPFAELLQYRNKSAETDLRAEQAAALAPLCRAAGVPFIVNDDARLAARVRASGVHLGEHDGTVAAARALLGQNAIIGVSCYDDLQRARKAAEDDADYIAFGAFFPSATKPNARRATPALLAAAGTFGLPMVAIGGITADNAPPLLEAGADLLAVVGGVFDAPDPVAAAREFRALFTESRP